MKIALVSPYDFAYPGGVTVHVSHLDEWFRRWGHEVKILAPSSQSAQALGRDNLIVIGRPVPVPSSGSVARISVSFRLAGRVRQVLEQERFDIVHIHEPLVPALPLTVLRVTLIPTVGTFHAYAESKRAYRYSRFVLSRWIKKLSARIAVSRPAQELIRHYFPGEYEIIPNGIDFPHFSRPRPRLPQFDDGKLNILFVGRMEKRKGLPHLLNAYAELKWLMPNCRLLVVGPGALDEESAQVLGERHLEDVHLLGYVPSEDLPLYYHSADVFCSPATGAESFGIVLLEAMAAGKAIVASNIPGYASVLSNGVEGLLVEPKEDATMCDALQHLLIDDGLRLHMGEMGRLKAQDYSWDKVAARVLALYYRVLTSPAPRESLVAPGSRP
ncbi:MAG: glycosyltransferase family 4 protein [Chloroflexi bacterium]|nr:glycosyltransferase family 4 protein [Chloroflexota bacterium]